MTYDLILGDYAYSSWSLRGWLLFEKFDIPYRETLLDFALEHSVAQQLGSRFGPARTVPAMRMPGGLVIADSLAMAEELASRHPDAGIWPDAPEKRAVARALAAEMHSGFTDLRGECPMNLRTAYRDSAPSSAVLDDVARLETIWAWARQVCNSPEGWLCGAYSAADAFFAPVAARLAGYNLPISATARAYVMTHLRDPAFLKWRALGLSNGETLPWYKKDYPTMDWPV